MDHQAKNDFCLDTNVIYYDSVGIDSAFKEQSITCLLGHRVVEQESHRQAAARENKQLLCSPTVLNVVYCP